jgi:hypothetical protein
MSASLYKRVASQAKDSTVGASHDYTPKRAFVNFYAGLQGDTDHSSPYTAVRYAMEVPLNRITLMLVVIDRRPEGGKRYFVDSFGDEFELFTPEIEDKPMADLSIYDEVIQHLIFGTLPCPTLMFISGYWRKHKEFVACTRSKRGKHRPASYELDTKTSKWREYVDNHARFMKLIYESKGSKLKEIFVPEQQK